MGDFFRAVIPIVFLIIWVISQVIGQQAKRPQPGKGAKPGPGGRRPPPKGVAQEIEEFLKRAAQQRGGGKPAEIEVMRPERAAARQGRRAAEKPAWQQPLGPAAVDRAVEVLPTRDDIAKSVESHLGSDRLAERARHLGDEIREVDEEGEQRLHHKFDHQVGHLATQSREIHAAQVIHAAGAAATAEVIALLRDPRGIRNAIIVSEILNRPEHRW
jgi:hypothetical protein